MGFDTILNRKYMVQMNVETDATVGCILRRMARSAGAVYTLNPSLTVVHLRRLQDQMIQGGEKN